MLIYNFFFFLNFGAKITKIWIGSGRSQKMVWRGKRKERKVWLEVWWSLAWAVAV